MAATDQDTADFARIEAMFGDRNTFINALPETERVSALGYIDGAEDPTESEGRRMWMANAHLLAKTFKIPVQDVVDDYDRLQMAYVAKVLQQEPRDMDPTEFHGMVKQRIDKRKGQRVNLDKLMDGLTEDYIGDQKPDFDAAMSKRLAEIDPDGTQLDAETRALFRDAAARQWFKMGDTDIVTGEAIAAATDYFVKGRDVSYTGLSVQQQRAVDALGRLDENDQRFAIARAAALAKTPKAADGSEPGFLAKLNKLTGRSIGDVARSAVGAAVELGVDAMRYNPAVTGEAGKTGKSVPTSDEVFARMEKEGLAGLSPRRMEIERKLSDALAGKADPVNTGGWASTALLLAGSNLPRMAIAMNPVGLVVNGAAYSKELEGELRDRGVPADRAKILGRIGAPAMAGIDFAQAGIAFKGWLPGGNGLVSKFASQLAKFAVVGSVEAAEQIGQEMAQDAVAPILQGMASLVDEQTPGIEFGQEWTQLWSKAPTTALAMLPYVLVGTGRNRWKDAHAEKLFLAQRDYVQALGFGKDVQKAVLDAPTADAIAEILQENWGTRDMATPEAQAAQQKLGDKAKAIDLSDGGASLLTPQEIMAAEAQQAGVSDGLDFRFTENGVEVLDAGGSVVAVAGNASEAAVIAARYQKNDSALAEASAWAESRNELPPETAVTVFAPESVVGEDGFTRDVPGSVQLDFYETNPETGARENTRSLTMEQATAEGYAVPAVPKSMAAGTYSVAEVIGAAVPGRAATVTSNFAGEDAPFRLVQAEIDALRSTFPGFNMAELPKPLRQSVASWLEAAKRPDRKGVSMVQKADALAAGLTLKPRSITPAEHAAMVLRAAQLKNTHDSIMSDAAQQFMGGDMAKAQETFKQADAIAETFEQVTRAANLVGSEAGRALAARRWLAVDLKTYDLVSIVGRIQAASGKKLDAETLAKLKELTDQNKELQEKIDALQTRERNQAEQQQADDVEAFVEQAKAGKRPASRNDKKKRGKKEPKKATREELLAKLAELGFDPVNGGEVTPAVADVIAKLGELHVEEGAKTVSDIDGRIKEDVPALSDDVIHQAFAGKIAEDAEPVKELNKRVKEFKKQAGLWSDIHAILESGEVAAKADAPEVSEKVGQLREILAKLRFNALKTERDNARLAELQERFNAVQDQLRGGYRVMPEGQPAQRIEPKVESVRKQIRELEQIMSVEDSIYDLEDRIRRKEPPTKKRREAETDALFQAHVKQRELRRELARIEEANKPKTFAGRAGELGEFLRAAKATADFSAAFRQAVFLAPQRPVAFTKAFGKAARAFFDSQYADRLDFEMRRQPGQIWRDRAGLYLSSVDGRMTGREESFTSSLIERLKLTGGVARASNRNMVVMLNLMRTSAFDSFRRSHPDANTETLNAMARYVNVATGRGELRGLESAAPTLAKLAFSPRFVASRIQLLGSPLYFYRKDKTVFREVVKDWLAFTTTGMAVLTLGALAGADVGDDPESHMFGKMNIGPLTIDIWGGLQQPASLTMKLAAATADTTEVRESNQDINVFDAILRFFAYKASPAVTTPLTLMGGETVVGEDVTITETAVRSVMPMTVETMKEVWEQTEDPAWTLAAGAMSFVGVGVSVQND